MLADALEPQRGEHRDRGLEPDGGHNDIAEGWKRRASSARCSGRPSEDLSGSARSEHRKTCVVGAVSGAPIEAFRGLPTPASSRSG
jgi:hypothetical protein